MRSVSSVPAPMVTTPPTDANAPKSRSASTRLDARRSPPICARDARSRAASAVSPKTTLPFTCARRPKSMVSSAAALPLRSTLPPTPSTRPKSTEERFPSSAHRTLPPTNAILPNEREGAVAETLTSPATPRRLWNSSQPALITAPAMQKRLAEKSCRDSVSAQSSTAEVEPVQKAVVVVAAVVAVVRTVAGAAVVAGAVVFDLLALPWVTAMGTAMVVTTTANTAAAIRASLVRVPHLHDEPSSRKLDSI